MMALPDALWKTLPERLRQGDADDLQPGAEGDERETVRPSLLFVRAHRKKVAKRPVKLDAKLVRQGAADFGVAPSAGSLRGRMAAGVHGSVNPS
jgi:hypothetical protein